MLLTVFFHLQNSISEAEGIRLQQALCFSIYQGFVFAYDSMLASQVCKSENEMDVALTKFCQCSWTST